MNWLSMLLATDMDKSNVIKIDTYDIEGLPRKLGVLLQSDYEFAYCNVNDDAWSQFKWVIVMNTGGCMETGSGFWRKPADRTERGGFLHGHLLVQHTDVIDSLCQIEVPSGLSVYVNGTLFCGPKMAMPLVEKLLPDDDTVQKHQPPGDGEGEIIE